MDPISLAIAAGIATKGTEIAVGRGAEKWSQLVAAVRKRLIGDLDGSALLAKAESEGLSSPEIDLLAKLIDSAQSEDATFQSTLQENWGQLVQVQHSDERVTNIMSGKAGGHVVQAGEISGGLSMGEVHGEPATRDQG
ncbi:hypothetical protein [Micromonospora sp. WMMA1947]|uniref:hypothetical protein n=1 Tax=Micromonospora sp. WMMA1947 TaxID=3015163 RepID=UPI00248BD325|nr:hypothetical protein [Micromonospora sp. WMMA1947]WBC06991.1 hypothetical protein O7604_17275 [Micromonospora sp. WMMA1947]